MVYYIKKFIITMLIVLPIYLIIRRPWRFKEKREWALGAFIIYIICLFSLVLEGTYDIPSVMIQNAIDKIHSGYGVQLIPFKTIRGFFKYYDKDAFWVNIISNVVIFIPWGFGLPLLWRKNQNLIRLLFFCLGITVFIELFQLFICRNPDIDDVILNFLGGLIGAVIYFITVKAFPKIKKLAE